MWDSPSRSSASVRRWPSAVDGEGHPPSRSYFDWAPATGGSSTARAAPFPLDSGLGAGMTGKESTFTLVVPPHPAHTSTGSARAGPIPRGFRLGGRNDGEGVHLHAGRPPHPAQTSTGLSTSGPTHPGFRLGGRDDGGVITLTVALSRQGRGDWTSPLPPGIGELRG